MPLDTYQQEKKRLEQEERKKQGIDEPEENALTLAAIRADENKNKLFGKMLEQENDPGAAELMQRFVGNKLKTEDFAALDALRGRFSERMSRVENATEELTPDLIGALGEHPEFKHIFSSSLGPEKTVSFIKRELAELAVTDPDRFANIADRMEEMQTYRDKNMTAIEKNIREQCEKAGINADAYYKAVAIEGEKERKNAIKKLVREQWGDGVWAGVKKGIDFFTFGKVSGGSVGRLAGHKPELDRALEQLLGANFERALAQAWRPATT